MHQLDEKQFEQLFRDEYTGLVRFAMDFVKDYEAARGIVQDSFASLWENRSRLEEGRPVKPYLVSIVANRSRNYLRSHKQYHREMLSLEGLEDQHPDHQVDALANRELVQAVENAIAGLPLKCREIFLLNRFENKKYQEIATQLGISVKTVEAQMSKALQSMRKHLSDFLVLIVGLLIKIFV